MGGPAFPTTPEIYMQAHENTATSTALHPPKVWGQFVDDVYSILKHTQLENFFHHLNNLHQNIKFTKEEQRSLSWFKGSLGILTNTYTTALTTH